MAEQVRSIYIRARFVLTNDLFLQPRVSGYKNKDLKALSALTGGCSFVPATINEAQQLFETETIISLMARRVRPAPYPATAITPAVIAECVQSLTIRDPRPKNNSIPWAAWARLVTVSSFFPWPGCAQVCDQ